MDTIRRAIIGLTSASSLLAAGCAIAPKAERYVPPATGSSWVWNITSTGSFGQGSAVPVPMRVSEIQWDGKPALKFESASGAVVQDRDVGVMALLDASGRVMMKYDPPMSFEWPLEVGRTWTQQHTLTLATGQTYPMTTRWMVEAYEDVTVPAGTFKAFKVTMADSFGFKQTTWSMPTTMGVFAKRINERPAGHPQGQGTQVYELATVPSLQ